MEEEFHSAHMCAPSSANTPHKEEIAICKAMGFCAAIEPPSSYNTEFYTYLHITSKMCG